MDMHRLPSRAYGAGTLSHSLHGSRFRNLPFSSAIKCNGYPESIQQMQERNFSVPTWAMEPLSANTDTHDPFHALFADLLSYVTRGIHIDALCGTHAYVGALDDEAAFSRAPLLSQTIARIVHGIRGGERETTFTHYALMHWYWALWRWMLYPQLATYLDIPDHARPTPYQLFVPHPRVFDLLAQPNLRDMMCQQSNPDVRWLSEGAATIRCDWPTMTSEVIAIDRITGELAFSPAAAVCQSCFTET